GPCRYTTLFRSVAVYDLSDPSAPRFVQVLPTTNGPEGILPIPERNLLAISSETDEGEVRSTVALYSFGAEQAQFPKLSSDAADPVPFGALSGLSANPADDTQLFAVSDNAYAPRIYTLRTEGGIVESLMPVTGASVELDLEGIAARAERGFWAAHEGETGAENRLVRIDADGAVQEEIALP